jgi:hypothetical protein
MHLERRQERYFNSTFGKSGAKGLPSPQATAAFYTILRIGGYFLFLMAGNSKRGLWVFDIRAPFGRARLNFF